MRGFERASPSRAGDKGTTTGECDDRADEPRADGPWAGRVRADGPLADGPQEDRPWVDGVRADGPQADGLQEELSPGNRVRADRAMQLQTDRPTDRGKSRGSAC